MNHKYSYCMEQETKTTGVLPPPPNRRPRVQKRPEKQLEKMLIATRMDMSIYLCRRARDRLARASPLFQQSNLFFLSAAAAGHVAIVPIDALAQRGSAGIKLAAVLPFPRGLGREGNAVDGSFRVLGGRRLGLARSGGGFRALVRVLAVALLALVVAPLPRRQRARKALR